mmetsp:Transcript_20683/g.47964  ORF Transcript_20683/g.47964 Transcript_20683/m.47964 type:complete len:100 (+) Transcript_20683:839-1138(+)
MGLCHSVRSGHCMKWSVSSSGWLHEELLQNLLSDKGKPDGGDPYLQVQICLYYGSGGGDDDGESNEEVPVLEVRFGADDEIDNVYGMNLYRCLDYGIEW